MKTATDHVTVIVCTFNRAKLLRHTLTSMMRLETGGEFTFDVLVIDNGSQDATQRVIEEFSAQSTVAMRGVFEPKPGVSSARNRGLSEARGPWIAFCDDDQRVDADWLRELLRMAREKKLRVVGGAVRLDLPAGAPNPPLAVRRSFGESLHAHAHPYSKRTSPGTGNLLIHRTVLDEVGGFDETLRAAGEDTDLFRRIREARIAAWYTPRAIVWHHTPLYRLQADYQRWSAQRTGWVFADRDRKEHGYVYLLILAAARLVQAIVLRVPQWLWAIARRDPWSGLGSRCYLWRCEGYIRCVLHAVVPRWLNQSRFQREIEFRSERAFFDAYSHEATDDPFLSSDILPPLTAASAETSD
jgi:GT2 family glycosyltransferase